MSIQSISGRGFTLIELLVVIAIIGILSSVVLASLNTARERSIAVGIAQQFQQIEKAFYLLALDEGITQWWDEDDFGEGQNPDLDDLANNTNFGTFLAASPAPLAGDYYAYDSDGDTTSCGGTVANGVNIILFNLDDTALYQRIDQVVDGSIDDDCGRIKYTASNGNLFYMLGESQASY